MTQLFTLQCECVHIMHFGTACSIWKWANIGFFWETQLAMPESCHAFATTK